MRSLFLGLPVRAGRSVRRCLLLWGAGFTLSAFAIAQQARHSPTMQSVTGSVRKYQAGRVIVLVEPEGKRHSLALDAGTRIPGEIAEGDTVTAIAMTGPDGRQHVNAISRPGGFSLVAPADKTTTRSPRLLAEPRPTPAASIRPASTTASPER
jgi:hypothetical protein